ncbi:SHOCT domain-containing protein [Mesorhizobium sp. Root157]|uniref:SHOCT domain-containing protein n=1 Tax=Mesorhizobium sp. Root157 TaxID=1736477 RepID=UPI000AF373B6|nr:SHOCT domain-containing protein [Mesorhizobium sp. Root157]
MGIASELAKLSDLLKSGILSETEYNLTKKKLLDGRLNNFDPDEIGEIYNLHKEHSISKSEFDKLKNDMLNEHDNKGQKFEKKEYILGGGFFRFILLTLLICTSSIIYYNNNVVSIFSKDYIQKNIKNRKWEVQSIQVPLTSAFQTRYDVIAILEDNDNKIETIDATITGRCWIGMCIISVNKGIFSDIF